MRNIIERAADSGQFDWLQRAVEAAGDLLYDWDLATDKITWIGSASEIFGTDDASGIATGESFVNRINPEDVAVRLKALSDHFADDKQYDCEYRVRSDHGTFCWIHDRGRAQRTASAAPGRMVGSLRLVNARKQHEARLERLASFDELTGHLNQVRLREALEHALSYSRRSEVPGGYLVIGVDKLSLVNNSLGHEAGDAILIEIGQRLDRCLRASDVVGRIGMDRFGIVLGQCSQGQMARAAERILQAVRETPFATNDTDSDISVSIGGVAFSEFCNTAYDVMAKGETALKQAKRDGRDRFVMYRVSEQQGEMHRQNVAVGNKVKEALRDHRLQFAFQPVVHAGNKEAVFHECLLRMRDENGEIIPAGVFIPIIEQLGLVRLIDRYVLDLAIQALIDNPTLNLAINISGLTSSDQSWLRTLSALVKNKPEIARRLIIELTETSALTDIEESARFLAAIRELGCRVAVDDFGAGFTSFRHLKTLTLDIVKIDGSFVRNLADNVDNQLFIRNLLGLAEAYGMETVAECVETQEDARFLIGEGVKYLQGYYFGRPSLETPAPMTLEVPASIVQSAG
jgi:diguanylate cyclase (GGDEF)-like protein